VSYSVDIVFHTPGKFTSAIRGNQPLMVHQRLHAPPMTVDQTAVGGWVLDAGWRGGKPLAAAAQPPPPPSPCPVAHLIPTVPTGKLLPVHVRRRSPTRLSLPCPDLQVLQEQVLTSCCCCSRGLVKAHVRVERDRYQPGESVEVLLEIDNRSKLPIKAIEVSLGGWVGGWAGLGLGWALGWALSWARGCLGAACRCDWPQQRLACLVAG
jgi:hypothetical protein